MKGVKDNGINKDVLGRFIIVHTTNVKQPNLQPMIPIPHKKYKPRERLEVKIQQARKIQISHSQTFNVDSKKTCVAIGILLAPSKLLELEPWAHNQGKGMERCGPRVQPDSHLYTHENVRDCEGMNAHTPKWTPTLRVGILTKS